MFINLLIILAVLIAAFVILVATRKGDFRVTRTAVLSAPPEAVFAQVNDFHNWDAWSPWAKLDPNAKAYFEGAGSGVGAIHRWSGNKKVGEGRMTILESRPAELVRIKLEFFRPFKATNTAEFLIQAQGNQTSITWSMFGRNNFMGKAFGLLVNCDNMIGRDFEKGLASMKSVVEGAASRRMQTAAN